MNNLIKENKNILIGDIEKEKEFIANISTKSIDEIKKVLMERIERQNKLFIPWEEEMNTLKYIKHTQNVSIQYAINKFKKSLPKIKQKCVTDNIIFETFISSNFRILLRIIKKDITIEMSNINNWICSKEKVNAIDFTSYLNFIEYEYDEHGFGNGFELPNDQRLYTEDEYKKNRSNSEWWNNIFNKYEEKICDLCKTEIAYNFSQWEGIYYCEKCEENHKCDSCEYVSINSLMSKRGNKRKCQLPCY